MEINKIIRVAPETEQQIAQLLQTVAGKDILVIPCGTGSHRLMPEAGGKQRLLIATKKFGEIREIAADDFYVTCQVGVPLSDLFLSLKEKKLKFPFLGADSPCTVGGMVGSGQLHSGGNWYNISRWLLSLKVMMADGEMMETGAVTFKSVAGYNLPKLFCGSFGTLGVFTDITLRCYPEDGQSFGKDMEPVPEKKPILTTQHDSEPAESAADNISRRIKQEFDPDGIFPVIRGWNN